MEKKIKLYLLSGFLGSGKTTFLTNLLDHLSDKKTGIIQNEFGKVGIDGTIVNRNGVELLEINRGSIFCSCLKGSFVEGLNEISEYGIEYLFVESSGLADPSNIDDILYGVQVTKGDLYDFEGAICVVDSFHFLDQIKELETLERQIRYSNLVVLNKVDLVDEDTLKLIKEKIHSINPNVEMKEASFGKFEYDFLQEDLMKNKFAEPEESTNTPENKPKTLTLTCDGEIEKEKLTKFLEVISEDTYRIKGFVKLGDDWNQVDVVNRRIDYKMTTTEDGTRIVFISKIGIAIIRKIFDNWNEIVGVEMKLR